ncbi:hypothetical protein CTAYLR_009158 [Chrysophaeum taylorii]|uniref:Mitochondrial carrier protein n=1 Tax=Chrysophaeum taylorii TaxID=2483200 RepID=A0AAD7UHT4_9STRA|nr:hypothetical protein CTAYLR_009158 [Chrysophaeum taylorii]
MVVTAVLNPYDRALFLSVCTKRRFLSPLNWTTPFHGVGQTIVSRSLSTGLYFPLEEVGRTVAHEAGLPDGSAACSIVAGNFAGAVNALLLSPLAAVKYRSWGDLSNPENKSVAQAAVATYERGGLRAFFTGFSATVARDMAFGAVFAWLRRELRRQFLHTDTRAGAFAADAVAAGCAAIVSSPFNYARNRQFAKQAADHHPVPTVLQSLAYFWIQFQARPTPYARLKYAQTRLMIGWGTLRVAGGMGLGQLVYAALCAAPVV